MKQITIQNIFFEITDACNLHCKHCYNSSGKGEQVLDEDTIGFVVEQCIPLGLREVVLSGGEALLHPNIIDILSLLYKKELAITIITNGTIVNEKLLSNLYCFQDRLTFQISLEGASAHSNDTIRGNGSFNRSLTGLSLLDRMGYRYNIRYSLTKFNRLELSEMVQFCIDIGQRSVFFSHLTPYGRARENIDIFLNTAETNAVTEILLKLKEQYKEIIKIDIPEIVYSNGCPIFQNSEHILINPKIDSEKNVYLCQLYQGKSVSLGAVGMFNFKDILNLSAFQKLLHQAEARENNPRCKSCHAWFICHGGCPAISLSTGSDCDDYCENRKHRLKLYLKHLTDADEEKSNS